MIPKSNNCVQATPGCALLFTVAQVSGAPDAERWGNIQVYDISGVH